MKTDLELKKDILAELAYEPSINAADIRVFVKQGGVLLNGSVSSYAAKLAAAHAAKRVAGVKGVADEVAVHLPDSSRRTDDEIAAAAAKSIDWDYHCSSRCRHGNGSRWLAYFEGRRRVGTPEKCRGRSGAAFDGGQRDKQFNLNQTEATDPLGRQHGN